MFGINKIIGDQSNNVILGSASSDQIDGFDGDDWIVAVGQQDLINGGEGVDSLEYRQASEAITADLSMNMVIGPGGVDEVQGVENLVGSLFDDLIVGDAADNRLQGSDGADVLVGGAGNDILDGGDGRDAADYRSAQASVHAVLQDPMQADGHGGVDTLQSIEDLFGSAFDDMLVGDVGDNILDGRAGDDRLLGGDGDDRLTGGVGRDTMQGGAGDDIYHVDHAEDIIVEAAGDGERDRVNVFVNYENLADVEYIVGLYATTGLAISGNSGSERITGSNLVGQQDFIHAGGGGDRVAGMVGDDELYGGDGDDRIFGNSGHDVIVGGAGADRLTGQFGFDRFVHSVGDGSDRITDFNVNQDLLDLTDHGFGSFAEVQALFSDISGGAFVNLVGDDGVLLEGIAVNAIGQEDVLI